MIKFCEVAVNVPQVRGVFHYHLPQELEEQVQPGHLVEVPFGGQTVQGVVLRAIDKPAVHETRPVLCLVDAETVLTPAQIALAEKISEQTLAPLADCIELMLPAGLAQQADVLYTLVKPATVTSTDALTPAQRSLLALLKRRGPLRGRQIDHALSHLNWRDAARQLTRRGILQSRSVLPPPSVQPKRVRTAQIAQSPEAIAAAIPGLGRSPVRERREAMLRFLLREPGQVDVTWVYAESGGNLADLHYLAERGLVSLGESEVWRDSLAGLDFVPSQPPPLIEDQRIVWEQIRADIQQIPGGENRLPILLHGVTGSGKTEIYLRAVAETIRLGRQAIVLVPEIALTPQTVRRFLARFPGQVGVMHSRLSPGERYDTWRRARLGKIAILIGARSALFVPFPSLGLVIVDEFHDGSYYQADLSPCYHAPQAAAWLCALTGAVCLFGSATPDVLSRYRAEHGEVRYLRMPARILAHREAVQAQLERMKGQLHIGEARPRGYPSSRYLPLENEAQTIDLPPVEVVDMRQELKEGNHSIFSRSLQAALAGVLDQGQQAILFLNRRGTATYVFCRDCGHALKCPHCGIPLTYHSPGQTLACHYCGYKRKMPAACPQCQGRRIRQYGSGTEKVEAEVGALFPGARILRWDYETTRQKGAHDLILDHFVNQRADILVGTQMIAKGLDLPLVTLVGVVLADVGLNLPDPFAPERTFQILTQVAGRAGRSPLGGQVILQTFQPEHYVLRAAAQHDYTAFYHQELSYRRQMGYPPFSRLVRLELRQADAQQAEADARAMAENIRGWIESEERSETEMIGPVPCFFSRLAGAYRWQIVLRGPDPASLLRGRQLGEWRLQVDPLSLL